MNEQQRAVWEKVVELLEDNREYIEANERPEYLALYDKYVADAQALLEQPEPVQEPIYQMQMMDGKWIDQAKQSYEYNKAHGNTVRIVYTTPPAQPAAWVGLTDEERQAATGWSVDHIESFLREKNGGKA